MQLLCILCVLLIHSACVGNAVLRVNDALDPELPGSTPKRTIGMKRKRMPAASQKTSNALTQDERIDTLVNKILEYHKRQKKSSNKRGNQNVTQKIRERLKLFLKNHRENFNVISSKGGGHSLQNIKYAVRQYVHPVCRKITPEKYLDTMTGFDKIRQEKGFITYLERGLADVPVPSSSTSGLMHNAPNKGLSMQRQRMPSASQETNNTPAHEKRIDALVEKLLDHRKKEENRRSGSSNSNVKLRLKLFLKNHRENFDVISSKGDGHTSQNIKYAAEYYAKPLFKPKNIPGKKEKTHYFRRFRIQEDFITQLEERLASVSEKAPEDELGRSQTQPTNGEGQSVSDDWETGCEADNESQDLDEKLAGESEEASENELKHTQASPYKGKQKSIFNVFLENPPPMQNNWTSNGLREAPTGALVLPSGSGSGLCPHQGPITAQHNYGDDENLNAPPTEGYFLERMHALWASVLDAKPLLSSSQQGKCAQWLADFEDALCVYEQDLDDESAQAALEQLEEASKAFLPR